MLRKVLAAVALMLAPALASAACSGNACDNSTLKMLYPTGLASGSVYIQMAEPVTQLNCAPVDGTFLTLKQAHPTFRETYALLLAAVQSKALVRVRIAEGTAGCEIYYAWILAP